MPAEMDGREQLASELSSYKRFSWPFHEMYDPSARPLELPATVPLELPTSPLLIASRRSNSFSPVFRSGNMSPVDVGSNGSSPMHQPSRGQKRCPPPSARPSRPPPSRAEYTRSESSTPSSSARVSVGPSSPDCSGAPSPREGFSQVLPIGESHAGTDCGRLCSLVQGLGEPTYASKLRAKVRSKGRHLRAYDDDRKDLGHGVAVDSCGHTLGFRLELRAISLETRSIRFPTNPFIIFAETKVNGKGSP